MVADFHTNGRANETVSGSVTFRITCENNVATIKIIKGNDIGENPDAEHDNHGHDDHGHEDHAHDMSILLANVRRWVTATGVTLGADMLGTGQYDVSEFAMYEVLVLNLKSHFHHMRMEGSIGLASLNRLSAACGKAIDIIAIKLDSISKLAKGAHSFPRCMPCTKTSLPSRYSVLSWLPLHTAHICWLTEAATHVRQVGVLSTSQQRWRNGTRATMRQRTR